MDVSESGSPAKGSDSASAPIPAPKEGRFFRRWIAPVLELVAYVGFFIVSLAAVLFLIGGIYVPLVNTEYHARTRQLTKIHPPLGLTEPYFTVRVRLTSIDENANEITASLFLHTRNRQLVERIDAQSPSVRVSIFDALDEGRVGTLKSADLKFTAQGFGDSARKTEPIEFKLFFANDTYRFPFDTYTSKFSLSIKIWDEYLPDYDLEVEKAFSGRLLRVKGIPDSSWIYLDRPMNDRIIIISSTILYAVAISLVVFGIWVNPKDLSGPEEAMTVAGFMFSAVGFREFAGLDDLKTRTILDVLVFLPSIAVILILFLAHWTRWAGRRRGKSDAPSGVAAHDPEPKG